MEIHHRSFSANIFLCSIIILVFSSCGINTSFLRNDKNPPPEKKVLIQPDSTLSEKLSEQKTSSPYKMESKEAPTLTETAKNETSPQVAEEQEKIQIATPGETEEKEHIPYFETEENKTISQAIEDQKKKKIGNPDRIEEKELIPYFETEENKTISQATEDQKKKKIGDPDNIEETEAPSFTETAENEPSLLTFKKQEKSDQQMLDLALEFCRASNDFWEQGDLDNALDALDQAYSLILKVNPDNNPKILQQKEDLRFSISKRIIEVYSSRFKVVNGYNNAIPLVMNRHVERAIRLLKGKHRDFFITAYRLSGRYRPAIVRALKEAGLPEELSWLPLIESGFKVRALSRARALGLWQFIASTGYKFGLKRNYWVDERMDPEKSTRAAIDYLKELHQIFGDWTTVLAAYNCGEGTVLKSIRTQRINYLDNFWDLYAKLPRETAFYVPKFMAVLHILNDPEVHGFILPPVEEESKTEVVTVAKQVHLKTMAKYLGISYKVLKDINPALRHNSTPPDSYAIKVPEGMGAVLLSKLDSMPVWRPPINTYVIHRVRKGESLSTIARRYRTSIRAIMALNGLKRAHFIKSGWKLKIPTRRRKS